MIVSNSGPLIHLAKIDRLNLLKELFGEVTIPLEVKLEVPNAGKHPQAGQMDSLLFLLEAFGFLALILSSVLPEHLKQFMQ